MRRGLASDKNVLEAFGDIVSRFGVEGASLSRLAEASGLKRASLYHHFPGGKDEIISAVVQHTAADFEKTLAPAFTDAEPAERAAQVAQAIDRYYEHGNRSCLIIALSISDGGQHGGAGQCVAAWSRAFQTIAADAGMNKAEAKAAAMDAVGAIEGALIIAGTAGDFDPFKRAIASLPERLTTT